MSNASPSDQNLSEFIKKLPAKPGIYKFFDKDQNLLYIGKAKNLKNRVSSYFSSKNSVSGRISIMVKKIRSIEFTIVSTESDALLLENSLIKKFQPKYNIALKDGKTYPYICIKNEHFPRVISTRTFIRDGSEYFGPFVSGLNKNTLLDWIQKNFFTRTCHYNLNPSNIEKQKFKVCLSYHIGLCKGPCEGHQTEENYNQNIDLVRHVLNGKTATVLDFLKKKMKEASENLEFESANDLKNIYEAIKIHQSKSTVVNSKINNVEVFSMLAEDQLSVINFLKIVDGSIIATQTVEYHKKLDEPDEEILLLAIAEMHERYGSNSKEIIVPFAPKIKIPTIRFTIPVSGDKKQLLDLSEKNVQYYLRELKEKKALGLEKTERWEKLLQTVKDDLELDRIPYVIECFDNSNIQGTNAVAAVTVFRNAKPQKSEYRHFNIKTVTQIDDFASMKEVVYRRYKRRILELKPLPDLIVIDGGKGQLSAAIESLKRLNIFEKVNIIGIAKRLEEIYKPFDSLPLCIDKRSPSNKLIQQIRNEAHRFGITHHRKKRIDTSLKSELAEIEGIGEKTAQKLLKHFKSVKKIKETSFEELSLITGKSKAKLILSYFSTNFQEL